MPAPFPFPGMNPYLESPSLWPEVHSWLIVELARMLNPQITPKYRAAVEKRVYEETVLIGIPDVSLVQQKPEARQEAATLTATVSQPVLVELPEWEATVERYLEIRDVTTGEVVTVIEVLSPKNKRSGEGRNQYLTKRTKVLNSESHLVEIDLLRSGDPLPVNSAQISDYRVLVSRVAQRPVAELYPFTLRDSLPCFAIPLRSGDDEPVIDLGQLMQVVYDAAALDLTIDYQQQPVPPLRKADYAWLESLQG
ncbi:DUF4058 family protein [Leptothoe spongobia]|uniref:DUF4058 family protein n=1 Tax=Leptothoe spongobia TAU-MAC 1115 TaxID=1967444 RepID=A0A947DFM5_9CYAN|nr:DUF4058 family protein [Leptothoe spongobia]MBT9316006.1 DUF4058 family protein [Leptothoe spongobia TAU-MAC 1115]